MDLMIEGEPIPRFTVETYYKGFRILLTHPFENGGAIVGLIDKMIEAGFSHERVTLPVPELPTQSQPDKETVPERESHLCGLHGVEMRKFEKNGHSWYSHKTETGWCRGKS